MVDAGTLAADLTGTKPAGESQEADMIVTPRGIDSYVQDLGKLIGYSINLALHPGLTLEDVAMFLE